MNWAYMLRSPFVGLYGLLYYTKIGYFIRRRTPTLPSPLLMHGQTALVTGASRGIGLVVARELWLRGALVYMLCRSLDHGEQAKQEIIRSNLARRRQLLANMGVTQFDPVEVEADRLQISVCDLSRPKDVDRFSNQFKKQVSQLDVLVNNAGTLFPRRKITPDGIEQGFATNLLGMFQLTEALIPLLEGTAALKDRPQPRVISVASGLVYTVPVISDNLQSKNGGYDMVESGARHKRLQMALTEHYWPANHQDILFASTHPGWATTPGAAEGLPLMTKLLGWLLRTPEQGAESIVWLAEKPRQPNGKFWFDGQVAKAHLSWLWTDPGVEHERVEVAKAVQACQHILAETCTS